METWDDVLNKIRILTQENEELKAENKALKERITKIYEDFEIPTIPN